jgi:hypothetical protein
MNSLTIASIAFLCMFGGTLLGAWFRRLLPGHHLTSDSRDVVKLGAGLIATQAALVLGLLVSSAKTSFDATNEGLMHSGARVLMLDQVLSRYGPESRGLREQFRRTMISATEQIWPRDGRGSSGLSAIEATREWTKVADMLRDLAPQNESQAVLKQQALSIANDLAELRWLLVERADGSLPTTFLVVLIFWFTMLFATFGMLAPKNGTVIAVLLVCALSVAGGVLLILEMSHPLSGFMKVSGAPILKAISLMGR